MKYCFIVMQCDLCDGVFQPQTSDADHPQVLVWCMQRYNHALIHNMYSTLLKAKLKRQTLHVPFMSIFEPFESAQIIKSDRRFADIICSTKSHGSLNANWIQNH